MVFGIAHYEKSDTVSKQIKREPLSTRHGIPRIRPEDAVKLVGSTLKVLKRIEKPARVNEIYATWVRSGNTSTARLAVMLYADARGVGKLRDIWSAFRVKSAEQEKVIGDLWFIIARHVRRALHPPFGTRPRTKCAAFFIKTTLCDCDTF